MLDNNRQSITLPANKNKKNTKKILKQAHVAVNHSHHPLFCLTIVYLNLLDFIAFKVHL